MPMQFKIFTFLIILIFSAGCSANSSDNIKEIEAVKRKLAEILPNEINLISIQETDMNGFFEVNFEGIEPPRPAYILLSKVGSHAPHQLLINYPKINYSAISMQF